MAIIRPAIGSVTLLSLKGDLRRPGTKLVRIDREGADGIGLRRSAKKPGPKTLRGKLEAADAAAANTHITGTLPALEGTVQTITINGVANGSYAIERAESVGRRPIAGPVGGTVANAKFLLDVEFDVIYAGV